MKCIFVELKIINNLLKIILKYLIESHNNLLNKKLNEIDIKKIIKYDSKLMVILVDELVKRKIIEICAEYGKFENIKWLHKKISE